MFLQNNKHLNLLERSLDSATLRQKVIANNIANVDTPFFKRSFVQFEDLLQNELDRSSSSFTGYRTHPKHLEIGSASFGQLRPVITEDGTTSMNNNNNNVDIDFEMTLMAKNQLRYNALIEQINHDFKQIRTAIDGRG